MATHQTIKLRRGRHSSPEGGACVMEVASLLAGETFSDQPQCVCPVISEFLRTYNDNVDDARRQDLFAYAALAVGSRADAATERRRGDMCLDLWLGDDRRAFRRLWSLVPRMAIRDLELAYRSARWAAASPDRHRSALALVEALCGRSPLRIDRPLGIQAPAIDSGEPQRSERAPAHSAA